MLLHWIGVQELSAAARSLTDKDRNGFEVQCSLKIVFCARGIIGSC
jgi:hypothetical protein